MSDDTYSDDELVSAVLDGEATAEEAARVRSDPALRARLEELRSVAERVGTPRVLVSPHRDEHLARAIAEADSWASAPVAPPIDLDAARKQRTRTAAIVSIAAVIAVLLVGLAVVGVVTRDDDPQTAASTPADEELQGEGEAEADERVATEEAQDSADADAAAPPQATESEGLGAEGGVAVEVLDLGSFDDRAALQAATTVAIDQYLADESQVFTDGSFTPGASAQLDAGSARARCEASTAGGDREVSALLWSADATLAGVPLHLFLYSTDPGSAANGQLRLYAVDQAGCDPIEGGVQTFAPSR